VSYYFINMFIKAHIGINCNFQINHFSSIYKFFIINIIFMISIITAYRENNICELQYSTAITQTTSAAY